MHLRIETILQKYQDIHNTIEELYEFNKSNNILATIVIVLESQYEPTEENQQTEETQQKKEEQPTENKSDSGQDSQKNDNYSVNYYGRLCIPDALIDVALYYGADQEICDRQDSANIFSMSVFDGLYISDHNTQEFMKLFNVTVGMRGYIQLANGAKFNIVCTDVFAGNHTGKHIVDENGNTNLDADFLMYTCSNGWQNVLICLWKHC